VSRPALFLIDALIGAAVVTLSTSTRGGKQVVVQADSYTARVRELARQLGPGKGESADQHRTGSSDSGGTLHIANSTALRLIHRNRRHHGGALAANSPCRVEDAVCHEVPAAPLEIHMDRARDGPNGTKLVLKAFASGDAVDHPRMWARFKCFRRVPSWTLPR
jgi:hypothetical protein